MTRIFSDAFPSWPHRSGAFTCRTTRSWVRNASIAASAFAIMSVSRPPVAPRTSMTSMPKVRNIPRISATPAIPAAVRWNRSVIGTRSGKMPAPRSTIAFAGGSPFATRARFTGWALRILYDCCVKALTAFAVTFAADSRGFDSWIVSPISWGSVSVTFGESPRPRNTTATRCSVPSRTFALIRPSLSPSSAFASSSVPSRIRPARRSVSFRSSSTEAKFPRKAMSPGSMSMPTPAASNGPRPVYTSFGSYPKRARWLVSLPAATPGAMGSTSPFTPSDANPSRFGLGVASRGVSWPSSVGGRAPRPSKITRRILRASSSAAEGPVHRYVFAGCALTAAPHQRFREDICRRSACSEVPEAPHVRDGRLSALWRAEFPGEPVLLELRGPVDDLGPAGHDSSTLSADVASCSGAPRDGQPDRDRGGPRDRHPRGPRRRGGGVGRATDQHYPTFSSSHGGRRREVCRRHELDSHHNLGPDGAVSIHREIGDPDEWRRHSSRPHAVRFPQLPIAESDLRSEPTGRSRRGRRPAPPQHDDVFHRVHLPDIGQHVDPRRRHVAVTRSILRPGFGLRHTDGHARGRLELGRGARFSPRNLEEPARRQRGEEVPRCDQAVRPHERHSHFIATHRHRKTVAEGPRLLGERPGDVRDDVAEAIVGDDDSIEAAFALLRLPEVEIDEIADRRADLLDLGPGHEMRRHRREEIASVERVGEFGPAQLSIRDLAHLLETESPRRRDEESVVRAHEEGSLADAHDRAALRAHAGVDHADVSGERIVRDRRIQDVGPVANVVRPDRMVDVHDCGLRVDCKDRALHGADVLARSEVGGQRDDRAHTLRPPQLRRRNPSLIRASSFLRRWISTSASAARASRSLSFVSRVLRADCATCTATCSAARASRSAASFASRSSMPARWAATASCRRFPSASARATRFSASDSRSSTSSIRCWRLSSFSRRAASCASTSRSPASGHASRRWILCFDFVSRLAVASERFSSFFVSCSCEASDFSSAPFRDSMSCRSERNAVSCSSKVAFNDSFDSDSFVNARSTAATSLSRRSTSPLLAAYSSSSAARRDRKSPSTTSAASDRSVVRSSAATAAFSRFSIAASRRFAAASRLSSSRSAVSIARSRCWAVRSERSSFTACAFILERLADSSSSMRSSRRFNCSSSFPRLARSRWRRRTST